MLRGVLVWSCLNGVLGQGVEELVGRDRSASWGIMMVGMEDGQVMAEWDVDRLLAPASNTKLFTGALALDVLGPDYCIQTEVRREGALDEEGRLRGSLRVVGRGDFSMASRFHEGRYGVDLEEMARGIREAGVRVVTGDLVGDVSFFRTGEFGAGWAWDDYPYYYSAEVSALNLEDNVVDFWVAPSLERGELAGLRMLPETRYLEWGHGVRTEEKGSGIEWRRERDGNRVWVEGSVTAEGVEVSGAVAVRDPARFFLVELRAALERVGVVVEGEIRVERIASGGSEGELVFVRNSPPLKVLLPKMMKPSQNLYAQLLFLQVGEWRRRQEWEAGREGEGATEVWSGVALREFLERAGVDSSGVFLEEGAGLSRGNLLSARAVVSLLRYMDRHRYGCVFRDSLPLGGVDGTLSRRFQEEEWKGRIQAKTGTLRFVHSLSGYATRLSGERVAFSVLLNHFRAGTSREARGGVDEWLLSCLKGEEENQK